MSVELLPEDSRVTWILGPAFIVAFLLAFSVGANDVSNSFGTSVGSGVLTVTQACILATIFEVAGSALLGHSVCDFFRQKMYRVDLYQGAEQDLMLGALGCLMGSAMWNILATKLKMPISGTHSVIGATIGFNLVLRGTGSVQWMQIFKVIASWFVSPLLSGFISSIIYMIISKSVISKADPLKNGLKALPLFYGATIFINVASLVIKGPNVFGLNELPWYAGLFISLVASALVIVFTALVSVPKIRDRILLELSERKKSFMTSTSIASICPPSTNQLAKPIVVDKLDKLAEQNGGKDVGHDNPIFASTDTDNNDIKKTPEVEGCVAPEATATEQEPKSTVTSNQGHQLHRQMARDSATEESIKQQPNNSNHNNNKSTAVFRQLDFEAKIRGRPEDVIKFIAGERIEIYRLFSSLQIMTACFASFAHGTNDVSNAVAPLVPIWNIWAFGHERLEVTTQAWLLLFGGLGICSGLWAWGRAVIRTVGTGLTRLTPSKGFSIELGAAISVLLASKVGIPISTTHCKVGSLVILGLVSERFCTNDRIYGLSRGRRMSTLQLDEVLKSEAELDNSNKVDWKLFGNIAITWIVTVPLAAVAAAATTFLLRSIVPTLEQDPLVVSMPTT